ncbi:MAG: tetratricopeptide repeat protein, partial [Bacteroidia bacterium]
KIHVDRYFGKVQRTRHEVLFKNLPHCDKKIVSQTYINKTFFLMKELLQLQKEGALPNDELSLLEKQLIQSALIQEQHKARWSGILNEQGLKKEGQIDESSQSTTKIVRMPWYSKLSALKIAASILFVALGLWWITKNSGNELNEHTLAYIQQEQFSPDGSITRGKIDGSNQATRFSKAQSFFEKQQYQNVIQELAGFDNLDANETMLLGYAYAQNQAPDYRMAIGCFEKVQETKYREKLVIMSAFCHIQLEQYGIARNLLQEIINNPNSTNKHIEQSKSLLDLITKNQK